MNGWTGGSETYGGGSLANQVGQLWQILSRLQPQFEALMARLEKLTVQAAPILNLQPGDVVVIGPDGKLGAVIHQADQISSG